MRGKRLVFLGAGVIVTIAAAVVVATVLVPRGGTGHDGPDDARSPQPVTYTVDSGLCDGIDEENYEDIVGAPPATEEDVTGSGESGTIYCGLTASDPDVNHGIDIRVNIHPSAAAAQADYEDAMGLSDTKPADMDGVDGSWDQGASVTNDDLQQYLLFVRDANLTLNVTQGVRPMESIDSDTALRLNETYALEVLDQLEN